MSEPVKAHGPKREAPNFKQPPHANSSIKKVIGVISGKGGVGKSLVTSLLAVLTQQSGYRCGIMDADITGPSIPKVFGITEKAVSTAEGIIPQTSRGGTQIMSVNLVLEHDTDPVVWRGPVIAGAVTQFWTDVIWKDIDFLFIDMPPGTGDVPLTVFQTIPVDGIVVVTSPQDLVTMVVEKAVKMARLMNIPILGLVENMSYTVCPDCGKEIPLFGQSKYLETAQHYGISHAERMPLVPAIAALCDSGSIEAYSEPYLRKTAQQIQLLLPRV